MRLRQLLPITLSAAAIGGLGACGGGSSQIVARVEGVGTVTEGAVNHWTRVEAILLHELVPLHPAPKGVVPDPPAYTACATYLRHSAQQAGEKTAASTTAALKSQCKKKEQELRTNTLNKLISWQWTIGRGQALGLHVTAAQAKRRLAEVIKGGMTYGTDFQRYLKLTGQTMADMLYRSRVQLYEVKMAAKATALVNTLPKSLTEQQRQDAIDKLATKFLATKSWVARTTCSKGFVVSSCKQYTGPEAPPAGE